MSVLNAPWLVLDTGCPRAVVAIVDDSGVVAETYLTQARRHAEAMAGAMDLVLDQGQLSFSQLGGIGVGHGPGSFVGVRVGIATAKGIAMARSIPLVGLCPLASLAAADKVPNGEILAVIDARRGQIYAASFRKEARVLAPLTAVNVFDPDQLGDLSRFEAVVGSGLVQFPEDTRQDLGAKALEQPGPSAKGLWHQLRQKLALSEQGAGDERKTLLPLYVRPPDAKLPKSLLIAETQGTLR